MDNIEIIKNLVAVEAVSVSYGKYSYTAIDAEGNRYPLASRAAKRENVFFYSVGNVNGNNKVEGALNGHCSYGKNPSNIWCCRDTLIRGIKVNFI